MQSPIYWHPWLYRKIMQLAYGKQFKTRYEILAQYVPDNCELLELCMGDACFYQEYLKGKQVKYSCADINPVFVNAAKRKGLNASLIDISKDEIPASDFILMQAALYHFIPNEKQIIQKLLDACRKAVIISENIDNLSNDASPLKSWIGEQLSKAKSGQSKLKFTRESLKECFAGFSHYISAWKESPDSKEIIIVLQKQPAA